jgi:hypothetical protein
LAVQVIIVDEPATVDLGVQETVVLVVFNVTPRLCVPTDGRRLPS